MTEAPAEGNGTYLYGVVSADAVHDGNASFKSTGVGAGAPVRAIEAGDLAAIVSDAPLTRYDTTRENLVAHEAVLEEVLDRTDVVPVAFGIVATNDQEVQEQLLQREADVLHQTLEYVKGRVEVTLQVLWNEEALFREIVEENPDIQQIRDSIVGQPEDAVYNERVQMGEMAAALVPTKSQQAGQEIFDALQPLALETRVNDNTIDTMVLNAAFLVEKSKLSDFDDKVSELSQANSNRLLFSYVGPLPPYDFVSVRIRWDE